MVATRSARFSRCVLRCQGSRSPSTALMLRAACSIPPIQTPNPSKNGPSSSRYPTVNHFRPKPIGGEASEILEREGYKLAQQADWYKRLNHHHAPPIFDPSGAITVELHT